MKPPLDIQTLVAKLVASEHAGRLGLAAKLQVSESTVARWESGVTSPRSALAARIRQLSDAYAQQQTQDPIPLYGWHEPGRDEEVRHKIHTILTQTRESLHKNGHLSSRNEALDEISKLLFAHVISTVRSGQGISPSLVTNATPPAKALRDFVHNVFSLHIPSSLAHDLRASDFQLKLRKSEHYFATELIDIISQLDSSLIVDAIASKHGVDILNEVFGQFLSDSFFEEKELGQYLTPSEVVRFMTRLGLASLPEAILQDLIHPSKCKRVGYILDPSCGVASFLTEAIRVLHPQALAAHGAKQAQKWLDTMLSSVVVGIDKSERMIRLSLTNLSLFGAKLTALYFGNALSREGHDARIANDLNNSAQLILTNPPFGAAFASSEIGKYRIATSWCSQKITTVDSELLFLERYIDWLKPGGTLVTIVPDSILTNRGLFKDLRRNIAPLVELRSVVSLPKVTFGAAGTTTKTSILHLVKKGNKYTNKPVYFSICEDLGYSVTTRSSQRRKISNGCNQLVQLLPEALAQCEAQVGRFLEATEPTERWDAAFHIGLSATVANRLRSTHEEDIFLRDVAALSSERVNPARANASKTFSYIEISDINSRTLDIASKETRCDAAPSRARKLVRAGDILVSTVRPERRTVGVVPSELEGAVCSTGFAVLRCHEIDPTVLARLLQSDFVNQQILRNNIGIAYPAISEECLLAILLPVTASDLQILTRPAEELRATKEIVSNQEKALQEQLTMSITKWLE